MLLKYILMLSVNPFNSLYDLIEAFPDDDSCVRHLEYIIWDNQPVSPFDPESKVYKCKDGRYKCVSTNKYFSVLNNTIFEGTKISLKKWFMAIYLDVEHKKGISSHQLARDIGVTQKTAWFILHRIRFAMEHKSFKKMVGVIEADETFVGGKNKNRHKDKKVEQSQGRSYKDKTPVLGLIERSKSVIIERPNKVMPHKIVKEKVVTKPSIIFCKVVSDTKAKTIQPIIKERVKDNSSLMTDEWSGYSGLCENYFHQIVYHSSKQYVDGDCYTNNIEGFWGQLKRGIIGIYHWVSRRHLQKYVDEFTFRYNNINKSIKERFDLFISMVSGNRLLYKQLVSLKK